MKYTLKPSLEHMALFKIVVTLWSQTDINDLLFYPIRDNNWCKFEHRVIEKVPHLPLPTFLKEKVLHLIKPIGLQILVWLKSHGTDPHIGFHLSVLCWTSLGTIDSRKTAEVLVKDEKFCITKRYEWACTCCIENSIQELWYRLSEDLKKSFLSHKFQYGSYQQRIVFSWTNVLNQGEWDTTFFSYKYAFKSAAELGNKAATEYFLQKLTPNDREDCLIRAAEYVKDANILGFLFSEMTEQQKKRALQGSPLQIFHLFLDWPLQYFFMEIADLAWEFLCEIGYSYIIILISEKIDCGYKDWNYEKLFVELWQKSPDALKTFTIDESKYVELIWLLLGINNKEIFVKILQNVTLAVKKKIVYTDFGQEYIHLLMNLNQWDLLKILIEKSLPTRDEKLNFKKEFENNVQTSDLKKQMTKYKHKWDHLFHLFNDSTCNCNERITEEVESSFSK